MTHKYQIKTNVQFTEHTAIPKEQLESVLFDIFTEDVTDNATYCTILMTKLFDIPYAQIPEFIAHHSNLIADPIKWLNKFEKLISENEELFHSSNIGSNR